MGSERLIVELFAAGKVVPQPRTTDGKQGVRIMAPARHAIRGWRQVLRMKAQDGMKGRTPAAGPIRVELLFLFPRPKRLQTDSMINVMCLHIVDPDGDNLEKAVWDSCKMVVWMDDCQVSTWLGRKRYAMMAEAPGVLVRVYHDQIPWIATRRGFCQCGDDSLVRVSLTSGHPFCMYCGNPWKSAG